MIYNLPASGRAWAKSQGEHRWIRRATDDEWAHGMKPLFGFFCERGPYRLTPNTRHPRVRKLASNQLRRSEPSKCHPCINTKERTQGFQVKKKVFIKQVICQFRKQMSRMNKSYVCISINYWLQQKCYQPASTASSEHRRMMACGPESTKPWSLCRWSRPRAPNGNLESWTKFCCPFILQPKAIQFVHLELWTLRANVAATTSGKAMLASQCTCISKFSNNRLDCWLSNTYMLISNWYLLLQKRHN